MSLFVDIEHRSFEASCERAAELGGADLIFTSPPYPTEVPGAKGREGAPTRDYGGDAPKHFLWEDYQRLGDYCFRALKPGGFCIVIIDGPVRFTRSKKIGSERSLIAFRLAIDWAERVGFRYVEHEAYLRDGMPGDHYPRRRSGWEPMHVFQRPGTRGYFTQHAVQMPAVSAGKTRARRPTARMWLGKQPSKETPLVYASTRALTTAIACNRGGPVTSNGTQDQEHHAPFTRWIATVQILSYSPPGGLVCDPFNGSGTTGVAAVKNGRSFVGGDLGARERDGARWADVARERAFAAMGSRSDVVQVERPRGNEDAVVEPPRAEQLALIVDQ